jgi:hypothetical protein
MKGWLFFFFGLAVGGGGFFAWHFYRGPDGELVAARKQVAVLTQQRVDAVEKIDQARKREIELRVINQDIVRRLDKTKACALSAVSPAGTSPESLSRIEGSRESEIIRWQLKDAAEHTKRRLQLTEAQVEQLDQVLGDLDSAQVPLADLAITFEKRLQELLTAGQKAKYDTIRQKNQQLQADFAARAELNEIEHFLDITKTQREEILRNLADSDRPVQFAEAPELDDQAQAELQIERRLEAVDGILTEPQIEEYRRYLATQIEGFAAFLKTQN